MLLIALLILITRAVSWFSYSFLVGMEANWSTDLWNSLIIAVVRLK